MVAGTIGRRNQEKEELHLFAVEAVEVDAFVADADGAHQPIDAGVLGVRHGDAAADAGAPEFFALENGADDAFVFVFGDLLRR